MTDDDSFSTLSPEQQDRWIKERTSTEEEILLRKTYVVRRTARGLAKVVVGIAMVYGCVYWLGRLLLWIESLA